MRSAKITLCFILALTLGCAELEQDKPTPAPIDPAVVATTTTQQAQTAPGGPNWFVAGGLVSDLVGEDGEPDALAGRYVNNGTGVTASAINDNGWFVAGPTGSSTWLDDDGVPQRGDLRQVLGGLEVKTISVGTFEDQGSTLQEFFVGGVQGQAQIVDPFGEPKQITGKVFADGQDVVASGFNATAKAWLIGGSKGQLIVVNNSLANSSAAVPFPVDTAIVDIVGNSNAASTKQWVALTGKQYSYYPDAQAKDLDTNVTLSAAGEGGGQIVFGTEDGKVALFDFDNIGTPSWKAVLMGSPVRQIAFNGTDFLLLSDNGMAQVIDNKGEAVTQPTRLGDQSKLTGAYWSNNRWLISTETSFVLDVNDKLEPNSNYARPLDGAQIYASDVSTDAVLVVGEGGKYRLVDTTGKQKGPLETLAGSDTLRTVAWSGSTWIIGGDGGVAQILDETGKPSGQPLALLGGKTIETASWNGIFWLIGGEGGQVQRIRKDGTIVDAAPQTIDGFDTIYEARWNGREWMIVGVKNNQGAFQLLNSDLSKRSEPVTIAEVAGPFYAVDWNGREWFMGGVDGLVQIASSEGVPRTMPAPIPRDLLNGKTIYTIDYHKENFIIGGENGLIRKIPSNLNASNNPVSVLGFANVRTARWSAPRGFAGNECLTSDACYSGPCIGNSILDGFCCDAACDKPCESCEEANTGKPNGVCSPVKSGNRPSAANACQKTEAADCGFTGFCDGAGECQFYGKEISCQAQSCSAGVINPQAFCDGGGNCDEQETMTCNPYVTCDGNDCAVSCVSSNDCAEGFRCVKTVCEVIPEAPPATPKTDEGCCATVTPRPINHTPGALIFIGVALVAFMRRRQ